MAQRPMQPQQGLPHPQYRLADSQQPMRIFINQQTGQQNAIHGVVPPGGSGSGLQMVSPISSGQIIRQPGGQAIQTSTQGSFPGQPVVQQSTVPQGAAFPPQGSGVPVHFIHRPGQQITVVSSQPQPASLGSAPMGIQPRQAPIAQPGVTAQTLITAHNQQSTLTNVPHGTVNIIRQPLTIRPAVPSPSSSGHTGASQGPPSSGRASSLSTAGGAASTGNPTLAAALRPAATPSPSFSAVDNSGAGKNGEILTRQRLDELVQEVDPHEQLDDDVKDVLLQLTDDFIEQVITSAAKLAKHRQSKTVDVKDVQMILERNYNMWIPGLGSDQIRPYKKAPVTDAHKQRMALIKKTMKKL